VTLYFPSILAFGTMIGAFIAHTTVMGIVFNDDGGMLFTMMAVVIILSCIIMYIRRRDLPLIGYTVE